MTERLRRTLESRPYLLGDAFSAADLVLVSPFVWFPGKAPDVPAIRRWMERCEARPPATATAAFDLERSCRRCGTSATRPTSAPQPARR